MIQNGEPIIVDPVLRIRTNGFLLNANISSPENPVGLVVLANGTTEVGEVMKGIAKHLQELGFATSIVDLLTDQEGRLSIKGHAPRSSVPLLRSRLRLVLEEIREKVGPLPCVLVASGVAAAAAISYAALEHKGPNALVLVDGRPELARHDLRHLLPPILFVVHRIDEVLTDLNQEAFGRAMNGSKALIEVGPTEQDWKDALQEIGAWSCQFALKAAPE